jgi:hypothetical protein
MLWNALMMSDAGHGCAISIFLIECGLASLEIEDGGLDGNENRAINDTDMARK